MAVAPQHQDLPLPNYFDKFAAKYAHGTGHSTLNILEKVLSEYVQKSDRPIGPESFVHDTAAGPGIGAAAIINILPKEQYPKHTLVSDIAPAMVDAARESLASSPLPHVECTVLDSHDIPALDSDTFTHSINNFSIFTFTRPRKIKPDIPKENLMTTPSPEFCEEGVLQKKVEEAGFAPDKVTVHNMVHIVSDEENLEGLTELMSGPFMARARETFNEGEKALWPEVVKEAIKEEVKMYKGIRFEAYALLAFK